MSTTLTPIKDSCQQLFIQIPKLLWVLLAPYSTFRINFCSVLERKMDEATAKTSCNNLIYAFKLCLFYNTSNILSDNAQIVKQTKQSIWSPCFV